MPLYSYITSFALISIFVCMCKFICYSDFVTHNQNTQQHFWGGIGRFSSICNREARTSKKLPGLFKAKVHLHHRTKIKMPTSTTIVRRDLFQYPSTYYFKRISWKKSICLSHLNTYKISQLLPMKLVLCKNL